MPTLEELLENVDPDTAESIKTEFETREPKWFRDALKQKDERIAELEPRAQRADQLEKAPKVRDAFGAQGLDWDNLRPIEQAQVEAFADFEDKDKVAEFITANKLPTKKSDEGQTTTTEAENIQNAVAQVPPPDAPSDFEAEVRQAKNSDELRAVMQKYNRPMADD